MTQTRETRSTDGETRKAVMRKLLVHGPSTAGEMADRLGLSAPGIRRHLDNLVEDGLAEPCEPRRAAPTRGRPAKAYRLTQAGRAAFGTDYDVLAAEALSALREYGGEEAVRAFARRRAEHLVDGVEPAGPDPESIAQTARQLAEVFGNNGVAAQVTEAGNGVQICQHHCPISSVAAEFPEMCEAEHAAVAAKLGQHIQPLATIAGGHDICTTNIPLIPAMGSPTAQTGQPRTEDITTDDGERSGQ